MSEPAGMTRAEAAAALGLTPKTISNLLGRGRLQRLGWGQVACADVEALVASRAEERERRETQRTDSRPSPDGDLVGVEEAARILACSPQYVRRLAASDRLPFVDAGAAGAGRRRLYRREQLQVIASARAARL